MKTKVLYRISDGECVGFGGEGLGAPAGQDVVDAPDKFFDYPTYFWKWNGVDAVELKTGADLAAAQARQRGAVIGQLIDKYVGPLGNPTAIIGSMEEMSDLLVQLVHKLVNGTTITQAEKNAFNLCVTTCAPKYKLLLADVTQVVANAMLAKKAAARQAETDMKNDPEWPV